jgi:molybdopterin-dependent oxidoreductase alpha subunit
MADKRKVRIVPIEEFENLKLHKIKEKAVGLPAITSALKHVREEMGLLRGMRLLAKINQKGEFDCPGCAWPDPDGHRSSLGEYCENGAKAIAEEATQKRITPEFFKKHTVEEMAEWSDYKTGKMGRLTHPMYLAKGSSNYEPISWEEAFNKIADKLKGLKSPDEAVFYTSGRTSNEAAFAYQLLARQLGTNNLPDCSNMCHESSGAGLSTTLGVGKGSVTLEDLHKAEVIMVMGQNPGTNHPRMLSALEKCKKNGGKIISVNPVPEIGLASFSNPQKIGVLFGASTKLSDLFMQVKINGDVALLKAIMKLMYEAELQSPGKVFDLDFIAEYTNGYDAFVKQLETIDFAEMVKQSGVSEKVIREAAEMMINNDKIIICWAMGLTQQENGVDNVKEVVNLLLLKGAVGREGAGTCPVRGHSNVQGDRTMGIWEKPQEPFLAKLDERFSIKAPREHGVDVVEAIEASHQNKVKFFMAMGGNFISATPDSQYTGEAVQNIEMTVQVSTKLNRSHLVTGEEALILPCIARSDKDIQKTGEQFVTVENSMGVVHSSKGYLEPPSEECKSEVAIVAGVGKALFGNEYVDWQGFEDDYSNIRDHIEFCIPGFDKYNERVADPKGFYLPNVARSRKFLSDTNKANFSLVDAPDRSVKDGHLIMMTLRSHDQYNTTIYGLDDRYRGIKGERRVVLMNQKDIDAQGLKPLEVVDLVSHFNGEEREALKFKVIPYDITEGCCATYFPETNVLVPIHSVAKTSNTPVSKFIELSIRKR